MERVSEPVRTVIVIGGRRGMLGADIRTRSHRLRADEPLAAGGQDYGPDPFEFLLAGLGACTVMTLRLYADRKGWPLDQVEVRVRHAAEGTPSGGRDLFTREIHLAGDLSEAERARLLEIADHCPVERTLSAGVDIRSSLSDAPVGEATS